MQVYCTQCSSTVWLARKRDSVHCNQVVPKKSSHHFFSLIHLSAPLPPSMAKHAHYSGIISIKLKYSLTQILKSGPSVNILLTTNFTSKLFHLFLFYLSASPPPRMAKHIHYTLLVQVFRQQKKYTILIQSFRPSRDLQEPKTKEKFQFL